MLAQRQSGMAVILDDVVAVRDLPKRHRWRLLLCNCCHLATGRGGKLRQGFVAERLDPPESVALFEFQ